MSNHKSVISSNLTGIGLGTALVSLSSSFTENKETINFLQTIAPTVSILGAYIFNIIFIQIEIRYNIWNAGKIEKKIETDLQNPHITESHRNFLIQSLENIHVDTIDLMKKGFIASPPLESKISNQSFKKKKQV